MSRVYRDWSGRSDIGYIDHLRSRQLEKSIRYTIQDQTSAIIASNKQLASQQISVLQSHEAAMKDGFLAVSENISSLEDSLREGMSQLSAVFEWGFSEILISLGHVNDSLRQLIQIAKTPSQTWAYEQFEIARDEFRRGLYQEALESVQRAINGFGSNAGFKSEFRFHFLLGTIHIGSYKNASDGIVNPAVAEQAFLNSARYAIHDYPAEAGNSYLLAGRSAYVQNKNKDAIDHTRLALKCNDGLGEAHFQLAKLLCAERQLTDAMSHLKRAIPLDRVFAVRAGGEGEFRPYVDLLNKTLEELRLQAKQNYEAVSSRFDARLQRLSSVAVRNLTMSDIGKEEIAKAKLYRDNFHEIARTNTLFGYFDAISLAANVNVFNEALNSFKQKAINEITGNQRNIADQIRRAESDRNKEPPYGVVWAVCVVGLGVLGVLSQLIGGKGHIIDRIIFSIFSGAGGVIIGIVAAFIITLLMRTFKGTQNIALKSEVKSLTKDRGTSETFLHEVNKLTLEL